MIRANVKEDQEATIDWQPEQGDCWCGWFAIIRRDGGIVAQAIEVEKQIKLRGVRFGLGFRFSRKSNWKDQKATSKVKEETKPKDLVAIPKGKIKTKTPSKS